MYRNEILKPSPVYIWNFDFSAPSYVPFDLFPKHDHTGLEIGVREEGMEADDIYCSHAINMCMRRRQQRLLARKTRRRRRRGNDIIIDHKIRYRPRHRTFLRADSAPQATNNHPPPSWPTVTRRCTEIGEAAERATVHRQSHRTCRSRPTAAPPYASCGFRAHAASPPPGTHLSDPSRSPLSVYERPPPIRFAV